MATLNQNALMHGASGKFGKSVVFRQAVSGKTVVAMPPRRKAPATSGELAERDKFRQAAHIAKIIAKDPVLGPQYKAKAKPGHGAYHVALTEHLNHLKQSKSMAKPPKPITREVSIEIAKLNMLAVNKMLIDQQMTDFVQKMQITSKKSTRAGIPMLKRIHQIGEVRSNLSNLSFSEWSDRLMELKGRGNIRNRTDFHQPDLPERLR